MKAKPRLLVTRVLPEPGMKLLERHFVLDVNRQERVLPPARLAKRLEDKDGLVCLLTDRIDRRVIGRAPCLKIIANYAVGYDNIDVAEASARRIAVTNTPDALTETTADLAFGLILAVGRRIVEADRLLRRGGFKGWAPEFMLGRDIHGKILGIIGMGRIGRAVARRARGFDMRVVYTDARRLPVAEERTLRAAYRPLGRLLEASDFVSIHAPLNARTRHLISQPELRRMKPTAFLVNTARGPIVDEKALVRALEQGWIAGCALDVYENEPAVNAGLRRLDNTVLVPHIGSASVETRTKMALMAAANVIAVLIEGRRPPNIVNPSIYR